MCPAKPAKNAPAPSPEWCLFLDVDGTLLEFTETPGETRVDAELKPLLAAVGAALDGSVALVSGRSIRGLDALFFPLRLPAAGLHGVERRDAAGVLHGSAAVDPELDGARRLLREFVNDNPAALLEDKCRTLAVHYRARPQLERPLRSLTAGIAAASAGRYHVQEGSMVFELKPVGFSKATAIGAFMQEPPFAHRTPVFIGDDLTDIDGFSAVEARGGVSIAVGDRVDAQCRLEDPAAVRTLLRRIAALARTTG